MLADTISNPPTTKARGTTFSVTDTTRNGGAVASGASTTRYYLSLDGLKNAGDTLLSGPVADQAALHGLLRKVRDLGMPLLSITPRDHQSSGDHHKGEIQ